MTIIEKTHTITDKDVGRAALVFASCLMWTETEATCESQETKHFTAAMEAANRAENILWVLAENPERPDHAAWVAALMFAGVMNKL